MRAAARAGRFWQRRADAVRYAYTACGDLAAAIFRAYLFESRRQVTNVHAFVGAFSGATNAWRYGLGRFARRCPITVKAILSRKGGDVATIAPTASLSDAVKLLAE